MLANPKKILTTKMHSHLKRGKKEGEKVRNLVWLMN